MKPTEPNWWTFPWNQLSMATTSILDFHSRESKTTKTSRSYSQLFHDFQDIRVQSVKLSMARPTRVVEKTERWRYFSRGKIKQVEMWQWQYPATAAGDSVVYRASLCDIDRVCKKHQEQKDDASETSFLSLSENDNNGNFIESSSQGTSTAPAGQGPVQQVWSLFQFYSVYFYFKIKDRW